MGRNNGDKNRQSVEREQRRRTADVLLKSLIKKYGGKKQVAEASGISRFTVNGLLKGGRTPDQDTIDRLLDADISMPEYGVVRREQARAKVLELLEQGHTKRYIGRKAGISTVSVHRIAYGNCGMRCATYDAILETEW